MNVSVRIFGNFKKINYEKANGDDRAATPNQNTKIKTKTQAKQADLFGNTHMTDDNWTANGHKTTLLLLCLFFFAQFDEMGLF